MDVLGTTAPDDDVDFTEVIVFEDDAKEDEFEVEEIGVEGEGEGVEPWREGGGGGGPWGRDGATAENPPKTITTFKNSKKKYTATTVLIQYDRKTHYLFHLYSSKIMEVNSSLKLIWKRTDIR